MDYKINGANRNFMDHYNSNINKMQKYLTEIDQILAFEYGLCNEKKFDRNLFNDFLEDEKFHELDSRFSDLLNLAIYDGLENNYNIKTLLIHYDSIQSVLEPLNSNIEPNIINIKNILYSGYENNYEPNPEDLEKTTDYDIE